MFIIIDLLGNKFMNFVLLYDEIYVSLTSTTAE